MDGRSWPCTGGSDQNHAQEEEMQKGKMVAEEALQIAEKRREEMGKGKKKRYIHLNAEFQRIKGEIRKSSSVINAKK